MKRGLFMQRDRQWAAGLSAILVLALAAGCGKPPTWGELTGQQPATPPPTTPVPVPTVPSQSPTPPVVPPKVKAAEVIARFKTLNPYQIANETLAELASLTEGLDELTDINATGSGVTDAGLAHLAKLPALKKLDLGTTKISKGKRK